MKDSTLRALEFQRETGRLPRQPQDVSGDEAAAKAGITTLWDKMSRAAQHGQSYCEVLQIQDWHKGPRFFETCERNYNLCPLEDKLASLVGAARVYAEWGREQGFRVSVMRVVKTDNALPAAIEEYSLVFSWMEPEAAIAA